MRIMSENIYELLGEDVANFADAVAIATWIQAEAVRAKQLHESVNHDKILASFERVIGAYYDIQRHVAECVEEYCNRVPLPPDFTFDAAARVDGIFADLHNGSLETIVKTLRRAFEDRAREGQKNDDRKQ